MPGLIGRKIGMTQIFDEDGKAVGVTVLEVGPCHVVQIKTEATDGYSAVQIGFGKKRNKAVRKPEAGHVARAGLDHVPEVLAEFDYAGYEGEELEPGRELTIDDLFEVGAKVKISGSTKGRGFQGVVKRHGFGGGRASHGGKSVLRRPGSIGAGTDPSRVIKGLKMAGQMGGKLRTAMSRKIIKIDTDRNLLMIRGSVPGARNNIVLVRSA
ncbi:MAG: 50S ribosomal protein L3 [Gemmatimonadota bacterium]